MRKTRIFEMEDPTNEKWRIYESLLPKLDDYYGLHTNSIIKAHCDRRTINKRDNILTIIYFALTEQDFYNIDYHSIKIITQAGLVFRMINTVTEEVKQYHTSQHTWKLDDEHQTPENWDNWLLALNIVDSLGLALGIQTERKFCRRLYTINSTCRFTSWEDFALFNFQCGRIAYNSNIHSSEVMDFPRMYQADLFDDIIDLTDWRTSQRITA